MPYNAKNWEGKLVGGLLQWNRPPEHKLVLEERAAKACTRVEVGKN